MSVRDAVIVSTARTPIGRAYKGAFNATPGATLGALSLAPAIERAGIDAGEIDDVVWGCVLTQGIRNECPVFAELLEGAVAAAAGGIDAALEGGEGLGVLGDDFA